MTTLDSPPVTSVSSPTAVPSTPVSPTTSPSTAPCRCPSGRDRDFAPRLVAAHRAVGPHRPRRWRVPDGQEDSAARRPAPPTGHRGEHDGGEPASHKDEVLATSFAPPRASTAPSWSPAPSGPLASRCAWHRPPGHRPMPRLRHRRARRRRLLSVPTEVVTPPGRYVSGRSQRSSTGSTAGESTPTFRVEKPTILRGGRPSHPGRTPRDDGQHRPHRPLRARLVPRVGAPDAPGTTLLTVSAAVSRPGIYEIPLGTRVDRVLTVRVADQWHRRGPPRRLRRRVAGTAALLLAAHPSAMATAGASIGAGVVVALATSSCGLAETATHCPLDGRGERRTVRTVCVRAPRHREDLTLLAAGRSSHSVLERLCHRLDEVEAVVRAAP